MKTKITLALLLASISFIASAQTNVPTFITSNQTWDLAGSPYIISKNSVIANGVTVTVDPGVVVRTSAKNLTLMVDGEFQAIGTASDRIFIDSLEISYSNKSVDYDAMTGAGAHFSWCIFTGDETTYKAAIKTQSTGIKVENSSFNKCYYGVNNSANSNDSLDFIIDNCYFGGRITSNYPVRAFGTTSTSVITNCEFVNTGYFYFYGKLHFEGNTVDGFQQFQSFAYFDVEIKCNTFKNSNSGLSLTFFSTSKAHNYQVENNTFDSLGKTVPMVLVKRQTGSSTLSVVQFRNNNFLHNLGSTKVAVSGMNSNVTTSDRIDFENNYWGTTDSAIIAGYISDYDDNINIFGLIDFQPSLAVKSTGCKTSTCQASYYLALDTANIFNLYVVHNSTGSTGNAKFLWDFGDGAFSTDKKPMHTYSKFGLYELCLTISDTGAGCQSTYCDFIGLDSTGKLLKADGFTVNMISEDDLSHVQEMSHMSGVSLYPNPSTGDVNIDLPEALNEVVQVTVLSSTGKLVSSKTIDPLLSNGKAQISLLGREQGLYFVQIQTGSELKTLKLILRD